MDRPLDMLNVNLTISLNHHQFERILKMASTWKQETDALIQTIVNGNATDKATQDAVTALQARLSTDEGNISTNTVSVSEIEDSITQIVAKLQASGDTTGALQAAQTLQQTVDAAKTSTTSGSGASA